MYKTSCEYALFSPRVGYIIYCLLAYFLVFALAETEFRILDKNSLLLINNERRPSYIRNRDGSQAIALPLHPRVFTNVDEPKFLSRRWSTKFDLEKLAKQVDNGSFWKRGNFEFGSVQRYFEEYLHGSFQLGEYYVEIIINGSEEVYLQLDTGSSNMIVNTRNCTSCNTAPSIVVSSSSLVSCSSSDCDNNYCAPSPASQACGFSIVYGSGWAKGALLKGNVGIANVTVNDIVFGGIIEESFGFEDKDISGLLGMAYPSLSCQPTCVNTLLDELYLQNVISHRIFTVLLNPSDGVLVLGGAGDFETTENSTPILKEQGEYTYYIVGLEDISVGNQQVWSSSSGAQAQAIVDTGTTLLYVTSEMFSNLVSFFESFSSTNQEYWSKLKSDPSASATFSSKTVFSQDTTYISSLPNISFTLNGGVTLKLPSSQYIMCQNSECVFAIGVGPSSFPNIIFGDLILQNYYVIFDQESSKLVFGPAVSVSSLNLSNMPGVGDISISNDSSSSGTIPTYGIVLIVVAAVAAAGLVGIGIALIVRKKRRQRALESPQYAAGVYGMRL